MRALQQLSSNYLAMHVTTSTRIIDELADVNRCLTNDSRVYAERSPKSVLSDFEIHSAYHTIPPLGVEALPGFKR